MLDLLHNFERWSTRALLLCVLVAAAIEAKAQEEADEPKPEPAAPARLLDRQPFDRVTLKGTAGGDAFDVLLLELPNRSDLSELPSAGSLELRRLSEPSTLYRLSWSTVARIDTYEQLLLQEANRLASKRELDEAHEYLLFLHKNYSTLDGLQAATINYLRRDAQATFAEKNFEETLTVLLSLYDLDPRQRGLKDFVERVTDQLISEHLAARDFSAARNVLELLASEFSQLNPSTIATWQAKFERGAANQLNLARQAVRDEDFISARQAVRRALAILPDAEGAADMLADIERRSPQIIVGVDQLAASERAEMDWTAARTAQLTDPTLLNLVGFGAEGGAYDCPWAKLESDDTGKQLDLNLNQASLGLGISAEGLALQLLRQADRSDQQFRPDFAGLLKSVEINGGNQVSVHWHRPHVRPESLLMLKLSQLAAAGDSPGSYVATAAGEDGNVVTYQPTAGDQQAGVAETIIERFYENEEIALADLASGELNLLARVPPWNLARLQQMDGIVVAPYRLPTVHVLLPNYEKPIMGRREFRRALCYGIDRPQILNKILLGGERRTGFRVLSAPLPAGTTLTDPVGYAYNQGIQPRPYEPRLAAVLSTVARNSLKKQEEMRRKAAGEVVEEKGEPSEDASSEETTSAEKKTEKPKATPLVLAHPPNSVATTACQNIQLQLGAIGIPIVLKPLGPRGLEAGEDYDLLYAELAMWEPIVDARRLLGPGGLAGNCSSSMSLALYDVDQANNWKEARSRLNDVHQLAFNDLPVIPLWQTVNHFAYRDSLRGVGDVPVTLYQNVADWQRDFQRGGR